MTQKTANRVGLYVQAETRDRLNALKDEIGARRIGHVSQDDVINYLLDIATKRALQEHAKQSTLETIVSVETMGQRIARMRNTKGWTQGEVRHFLTQVGIEVSQSYLSQVESDESIPGSDKIAGLARVFGVSADYLLLLTDDPTPRG